MRKISLALIIGVLFNYSNAFGQACGICNIDYGFTIAGVYPDTLPPATAGEYYEFDITFVMAADTAVPGVGTLDFLNYYIMEPVGLPYGMNVSTNVGDFPVNYDPAVSLYGCARVCGTPLVPGWYEVTVPLIATLEFPGGDQAADYSLFIEVLPPVPVDGGIIATTTFGCEPVTVDFETSIHSDGASGFSYTWDFGNGLTSTAEFPPTQTYTAIGGLETQYIVTHTITIDTIGYSLDYVTALSSGCDDCTIFGCTGLIEAEKPDLYILIDALGVNTWPGFADTPPPVTFSLGTALDPAASYTMQMKDDDAGPTGSDDNCGSFTFNGDDVGITTITSGSHSVEIGISHPVISYTFYDTITVYPSVPVPDITVSGETTFCEGDSVVLDASLIDGATYQWIKDGIGIPGATATSYTAFSSGVYSLLVTGVGGCNATSVATTVNVYEVPTPPAIIVIGNTLTTSSTWDVQWYYDGSPIPGATNTTYTPAVEGDYSVVASNGPCSASSIVVTFEFQSVENIILHDVVVQPNPNNGTFTCSFTVDQPQTIQIQVTNILGAVIYQNTMDHAAGWMDHIITLPTTESGIYFMYLQGENCQGAVKIMVE